jgi:hypothetical protein
MQRKAACASSRRALGARTCASIFEHQRGG